MITEKIRDKINKGKIEEDELQVLIYEFAESISKTANKLFKKKEGLDNNFIDYFKIEAVRSFVGMVPSVFYIHLGLDKTLREVLNLKILKKIGNYIDYDRKRKKLSYHMERMIYRNLKVKNDEIYVLDTTVVSADLNRKRKGKKIKQQRFDAEFIHDSLKGTKVGYLVATLINLSNLSIVDIQVFPKETDKLGIWQEMIINNLGTISGEIKAVIADAGFSTYKIYQVSMSNRIIPIVKGKKNMKRLEGVIGSMPVNLSWLDSRYSLVFDDLVKDLNEIISYTLEAVNGYDDFKERRAKIELLFKAAKALFGARNMHIYYRDLAMPRITMCLYTASLFLQFCMVNGLKEDVIIERLRRRRL
jgi:hypothetical protein